MKKQSIGHSALLVIDVQDSFMVNPRWERRVNSHFESNVAALIAAYRNAGQPIFFILHTDGDPGFGPNDPEVRLMSFIERRPEEALLLKTTRNSFTSTDLEARLQRSGVTRVVITGIQTEQCCETTARLSADLGFDVDFVTEATQTFPIPHRETGRELAARDVVERTEFALRDRFARIASVEDIVAELAAFSN